MITATANALAKIASLRNQLQMPDGHLKVALRGGGCSGFMYEVEITSQISEGDRLVVVDQETEESIVVDRKSYLYLNGMEIDFSDDIVNGGFKFNVPGSKSCGCGMSFAPGK